ncbi:tetratricopeptide repeat protein 39C-like [Diadema antillarum]|uniref:tetratricopeptide repeat protein 39C-like n=1 Tax=Diadema antillarum TaxID=105358 RepID=UPI003A8559D7
MAAAEVVAAPEVVDDVKLSLEGINLLLNNGFKEAMEIFTKYRYYSPLMSAGSSFVSFMNALMTYEDDKLDGAMEAIKETDKLCNSHHDGFMKSLKQKLLKKESGGAKLSIEERLQRRILSADCQLYMAMLIFSRNEVTGFLKGGWLIRKGYKLYEKVYRDIATIYEARGQKMDDRPELLLDDTVEEAQPDSEVTNGEAVEAEGEPATLDLSSDTTLTQKDFVAVAEDSLARLKGGVSFGYGLLQLVISMMPPSLLKVVNLLGFHGNREFGLKCLDEASHSTDMKAPLAMLTLLWYHTVVRPFFGIDSKNKESCINEALKILEERKAAYPNSALVMFYEGRVQKLQGNLDLALKTYEAALEACVEQREIQLICLYELGWCNLMRLNWEESLLAFARLKDESRWAQSYYAFLTAICQGALGQVETAQELFREVPGLAKKKNNQLESFVIRKAGKFKKKTPTAPQSRLMAIEVLYLWKAMPDCSEDALRRMLKECDNADSDKTQKALIALLKGAIHRCLGNVEIAMQCFEDCMALSGSKNQEGHAAPYACFELGAMLAGGQATASRGKALILRAKDNYKDYDFEQRLSVRIHAALQQLKGVD